MLMVKLNCIKFKVWAGRYNKIVVAKDSMDAIKKSKYKNVDQVEKVKSKVKC